MKLIFSIEITEGSIICSGNVDTKDPFTNTEANTLAVGALEIAKASLLAQRWGMNIGDMKTIPIVKDKKRKCGLRK